MIFLLSCATQNYDYTFDPPAEEEVIDECSIAPEIEDWDLLDSFMLGVKTFSLSPSYEELYAYPDYEALPLNTIGILFTIPYNEQGEVQYPYTVFGRDVMSFEDHLCKVGRLLHAVKSEGLYVYLSIEPHFYDRDQWSALNNFETQGPPKLTVFEDSVAETFLEEVHPYLKQLSDMSQKYKVDLVAPITEPSKYFGLEPTNDFMQRAKEDFASYSGRLVWQVYGEEFLEPNWEELLHRYDFRGYDTLGLAVLGCDQPYESWDRYIDTLQEWAIEDGVEEIFHAEFGCIGDPSSQEDALWNMSHWYDRIMPESLGVIVLDVPQGGPENAGVAGTWMEEWLLNVASQNQLLE